MVINALRNTCTAVRPDTLDLFRPTGLRAAVHINASNVWSLRVDQSRVTNWAIKKKEKKHFYHKSQKKLDFS